MEELLTINHLIKTFGKRRVVDDVSFSVQSGEVFGFLGPNGAGKTTTIKMVMGFLFPDSGDISICGYSLKNKYEKAMAHIGGIVENPEMFKEFSGRKNIEMYARIHGHIEKKRIDEVIDLVGMSARANEKVKKYSLGMKQRICLAQSLVHSPRVLILDEPTNGLDPAGIKELREILKKLAHEKGIAVLVSSHQLSEMQLMCDRVGIIDHGQLLGTKSVHELTQSSQGERYRFRVGDTEKAKSLLQEYQDKICETAEHILIMQIAEEEVPAITALLAGAGVPIYGIEKIEQSLEDAFMNITGGGNIE
ncbi:MAG: ABC transporter ATP-binding protein [Clostridiales bacterium]|nr:ABC transporter ATP-binding protein [Clostridiales bacterium]